MTQDEAMQHIRDQTPLNRVRAMFSSMLGTFEQLSAQRNPPTPVDIRIREFEGIQLLLDTAVDAGLVSRLSDVETEIARRIENMRTEFERQLEEKEPWT